MTSRRAGDSWRRRVFDAREHVEFLAIETRPDGVKVIHDGVSGMSGGEGQELIAFILGAALRFRLGEGTKARPATRRSSWTRDSSRLTATTPVAPCPR